VSRYQKGKTNLDFTKARDSEWQYGISWAMCKSAASVASERTAVYPAVLAAGWSIVQSAKGVRELNRQQMPKAQAESAKGARVAEEVSAEVVSRQC